LARECLCGRTGRLRETKVSKVSPVAVVKRSGAEVAQALPEIKRSMRFEKELQTRSMIGTNPEIPAADFSHWLHSQHFICASRCRHGLPFSKKQTPHLQVTWDEPLSGLTRAGDVDSRRGWGREKAGTFLLQAFYRCAAN
jgi:hypothetical protein